MPMKLNWFNNFYFISTIIVISSSICSSADEYVLQAGDLISINVVEHPEFSGRHYPGDTMYVPETLKVPWLVISTILTIVSLSFQIVLTISNISSR